jgi:hypothetical protein
LTTNFDDKFWRQILATIHPWGATGPKFDEVEDEAKDEAKARGRWKQHVNNLQAFKAHRK